MRGEEREVRDRFRRRFDPNLLFARDRRAFAFGRIDRRPRGAPSGRGGTCAWEASRSVRTTGSRRRGCLRGGRSGRTRRRRRRGGEVAATRAPCTDDDASLHADADLRSRAQSASLRARSVRFLPPRRRHFRARHATRHALVARNGRRRAHPRGRASEHRGPHHLRASPARAPRPTAATTRVAPSSSAPQQQNEATNESRIRTSRRARLIANAPANAPTSRPALTPASPSRRPPASGPKPPHADAVQVRMRRRARRIESFESFYTLVPIRPRSRGERRSLRTFAGDSLRPLLAFNARPRRLSTPTDAFQLHPDDASLVITRRCSSCTFSSAPPSRASS